MVEIIKEEENNDVNMLLEKVSYHLMNLVNCNDIEIITNSYNFLEMAFTKNIIENGITVPNGYYAGQFIKYGRENNGQYKAYKDKQGNHYFVSDFWKLIVTEQMNCWLHFEKECGKDIIALANSHLKSVGEDAQTIDKIKILKIPYYNVK
ncbi:MAG: hypothetical protein WDA21_00140 [Bacilli bacterium]